MVAANEQSMRSVHTTYNDTTFKIKIRGMMFDPSPWQSLISAHTHTHTTNGNEQNEYHPPCHTWFHLDFILTFDPAPWHAVTIPQQQPSHPKVDSIRYVVFENVGWFSQLAVYFLRTRSNCFRQWICCCAPLTDGRPSMIVDWLIGCSCCAREKSSVCCCYY